MSAGRARHVVSLRGQRAALYTKERGPLGTRLNE
jgi:hypothetical protein